MPPFERLTTPQLARRAADVVRAAGIAVSAEIEQPHADATDPISPERSGNRAESACYAIPLSSVPPAGSRHCSPVVECAGNERS